MARHTYRLALRAKGIKPVPRFDKLRTNHLAKDDTHVIVTASEPERKRA